MSVLSKLNMYGIRVTDIASQYWCERQMELRHIYVEKVKRTKEMQEGEMLHQELEEEANIQIELEPKNYADYIYKSLYMGYLGMKNLPTSKHTREVQIYGSLGAFRLSGKIDEIRLKDDELYIYEDKTRQKDELPDGSQKRTHMVQLLVYRKMIDDIRSGAYGPEQFKRDYSTRSLRMTPEFTRQFDAVGIERELQSIDSMSESFFGTISDAKSVSDTLQVRYINQFTKKEIGTYRFSYDDKETKGVIDFVLKYWNGARESLPVPAEEAWKCRYCSFFGKECKVWWPQKGISG
ncbi:MAG: exonuclease V [Candidatus Marsarchaeota archaeon]|nr:exonuclease V [Candidatus Marsarchaeota archaeon]MCL5112313.1 exonuclease V [Candidatus Marsarchaeota archaeon]